jgi:hypothetical protein
MTDQTFILPIGRRSFEKLFTFISSLDATKEWAVTVGRVKKERSDLQNRALWGCAYKALHEATGNDPEDLHAYFCGEFFGWAEYTVMNRKRLRPRRSTTKDEHGKRDVISTRDLSDFYAFIQRRAAETVGVFVPDPDPRWWQDDKRRVA